MAKGCGKAGVTGLHGKRVFSRGLGLTPNLTRATLPKDQASLRPTLRANEP